jgi:PadR family transcriptional regulator PadR
VVAYPGPAHSNRYLGVTVITEGLCVDSRAVQDINRGDVFPLLVLHLIAREPTYGNRLIESIERITQGTISVNPNTMYPLLREMESRGLVEGSWELPDRRTRRFYSITPAGKREYRRLKGEVEPFLDSVIRSVSLIKDEVYGD